VQGALFATTTAGSEIATDIETGFLNRLSLTPLQRTTLIVGQLPARSAWGMLGALLYLAVGLIAGVGIASGVGGVLVLLLLTSSSAWPSRRSARSWGAHRDRARRCRARSRCCSSCSS
jgi:hypothetical protein